MQLCCIEYMHCTHTWLSGWFCLQKPSTKQAAKLCSHVFRLVNSDDAGDQSLLRPTGKPTENHRLIYLVVPYEQRLQLFLIIRYRGSGDKIHCYLSGSEKQTRIPSQFVG